MSSSDKSNTNSTENEAMTVLVLGAFLLMAVAFFLPLFLLSFPFAVMYLASFDDDRPLISFGFALIVGLVTYLFLYGVGENFEGIIFGQFETELFNFFEWVSGLKYSEFVLKNSTYDDIRIYFWFSFPVGVLTSFFIKIKESSKKKKKPNAFENDAGRDFGSVLKAIKVISYPYFYLESIFVRLAVKFFSERLTAGLFIISSMSFTLCLTYLTFGQPVSWYMQFGFLLNKGLFLFKVLSPWWVNLVKFCLYYSAVIYVLVRLKTISEVDFNFTKNKVKVLENNSCAHWGGVYLGKDHKSNPIVLDNETLNHHVHVVGASGFGKTTFLLNIIKEKIDAFEGVIFVDLKGDIDTVCEIASFAKNSGRINDFEFFSISEDFLKVSKGVSLFDNGNAQEIKDKIMGAFNYDHVYYKKRIESFLNLTLRALVSVRDEQGIDFDFNAIYKLTRGFEHIEDLAAQIEDEDIKEDLLTLAADKKLKEDLTGLRADIEGLIKTDFGHLLSKENGINFYESIRKSKIVYVHLDSQRYEASAEKLGRVILQDIKTASAKIVTTVPKRERSPLTLIVDEFANLATEQFVGFLNKARSSGIGIVIAHQELSDLDVFSPTVRDQVMTNTSTLFSFLQKLPSSAETIAGIAGTYKTEKETEQIGEEGIFFKTKEKTGVGSVREVEEYLIHPNMIKELTRGECFMISKYPYSRIAKISVNYLNFAHMDKYELMEELQMLNGIREASQISFNNRDDISNTENVSNDDWL